MVINEKLRVAYILSVAQAQGVKCEENVFWNITGETIFLRKQMNPLSVPIVFLMDLCFTELTNISLLNRQLGTIMTSMKTDMFIQPGRTAPEAIDLVSFAARLTGLSVANAIFARSTSHLLSAVPFIEEQLTNQIGKPDIYDQSIVKVLCEDLEYCKQMILGAKPQLEYLKEATDAHVQMVRT